jgi:hypothetical protein
MCWALATTHSLQSSAQTFATAEASACLALVSVWTGLLGLRVKVCGMGVSCGIGCDSVVLSVFVLQRPLVTLSALGTATAIEGFVNAPADGLGRIATLLLHARDYLIATHQTEFVLELTIASVCLGGLALTVARLLRVVA